MQSSAHGEACRLSASTDSSAAYGPEAALTT